MQIPYVIDNIETRLADVLNDLLRRQTGQQVDIATAYFSIRGFQQLRATLPNVRRLRLLLGDKPLEGEDIGLRPDSAAFLRHELNAEPFNAATLRLVEELVRFLRRDAVEIRLYRGHAPGVKGRRAFLRFVTSMCIHSRILSGRRRRNERDRFASSSESLRAEEQYHV
jgi:hypothetical protein